MQTVSGKEFRADMHQRYAAQFALHRAVTQLLEVAIAQSRSMVAPEEIAIDMLMTQAYKSHYSVRLMAERAQTEDAAVLTRRLLELAAQAAYMALPEDAAERRTRAGHYLAQLWFEAPPELKQHIPTEATRRWESIWSEFGLSLRTKNWAPPFDQIFQQLGQRQTYDEDYRFLSRIAHGSSEEAILHYSKPTVAVRSHLHVPGFLNYSTRYYLALAHIWDDQFHLVDQQKYKRDIQPLFEAEFASS